MTDDWLSELDAFARAYPANAAHLAEASTDPDVERLAEAFDFISAKVRRIIDRRSPAMIEPFAELICPELLRPLPSATVLQLTASPPRSRRLRFSAGAQFESVVREGTVCTFRAMSSFEIVPWTIADARAEWSAEHGQAIVVELFPAKATVLLESLFPLHLHLASDTPHAETVLFWLCRRLSSIELLVDGVPLEELPPHAVRPWGLERTQALLPIEPNEHPGFRLLREYFAMPQKFAFAEVDPPGITLPKKADRVTLVFRLDAMLPAGMTVTPEAIRLNCVPVVNVFDATSDPVQPSIERPVHRLRVAGVAMEHASIYAIRGATGRLAGECEARPITSLLAFGAAPPDAIRSVFYSSHCGRDISVSIASTADAETLPAIDFASFDLWATNGTLASELGVGEVNRPAAGWPPGILFRNIRAMTPYVPAPREGKLWERATALLAMSARQSYDASRLRRILRCLDPSGLTRTQAGRAEARRIAGIERLVTIPARVTSNRALIRGRDIVVDIGQGSFQREGEVFVFASILDHMFSYETGLNTYSQTTVRWTPTGLTLRFPPRNSGRPLD